MEKNVNTLLKWIKKRSLHNNFLVVIVFLISLSTIRCANMQTPTGGPKDSIPPKILNESPVNFTRNFAEKEIVLSFDEYIKLNNQHSEFSISPDLDKQPEYRIKKRDLIISLPDSLEENTTYTINFGKGLVDFNEGNPIINYNYVFSTGPELDSLSISGSVKNAYTKTFDPKQDLDVRVLLIPTRQDSIFGKRKANIFTSVDSSGNFTFKNLREDIYRIYALKEENNDRIYNQPSELIGFLQDSLVLNGDTTDIQIEYSKGKPKDFRILERKVQKDSRALVTFNQPLDTPSIDLLYPENIGDRVFIEYSAQKDSATLLFDKMEYDSLKFVISDRNTILDTVIIRRGKNEKYDRELIPTLNISNKVDRVNHITITTNFPIANIDKEKIILLEDSTSRRNFQLQKDTFSNNVYHLRYNWRAKRNYELTIEENAIVSIFDDKNKESKSTFTLDETDNFGDILFTINGLDSNVNYIIELTDDTKEKIINRRIIRNTNQMRYTKFPGGKYVLRIIKDINGNGRWDGADVYGKIQAENIWYLDKPFTIRANWEQTETVTPKFE